MSSDFLAPAFDWSLRSNTPAKNIDHFSSPKILTQHSCHKHLLDGILCNIVFKCLVWYPDNPREMFQ